MDSKQMEQKCLERLRAVFPEPWFVWWGIGAGVHCEEAMGFVRPHGDHAGCFSVTDSLPLSELLCQLQTMPEVNTAASLAQSGNYVVDDAARPQVVWFNNGRVVRIAKDEAGCHLAIGTDFQTKDQVFF